MGNTNVLSRYETITTVLSIIAICVSILIPLTQWIWKRWIVSEKVTFYPTGLAMLFFNQSGSYIHFNGVIESERKATTIKKMSLVITRKNDERKLNLVWSYLISPVNQKMLGNFVQTTEMAHPFRVEADSVACAFVEYSNPTDSAGKKIRRICNDLFSTIQPINPNQPYMETITALSKSPDYIDAKNNLLTEFFWEIGRYTAEVTVEFGKTRKKAFIYEFEVSEQNSLDLRKNIDESLNAKVKDFYRVPLAFTSPMVEISVKKA